MQIVLCNSTVNINIAANITEQIIFDKEVFFL
jgi:hypothetical protein